MALVSCISAIFWDSAAAAPALGRCGAAVWFADSGGLTASGETNEPGALAAAHRSLPFGTEVRVENLANSRSVVVRVNDRGPFTAGRIISVSSAAADELDMKHEGVAEVRLTLLDGDNPPDDDCGPASSDVEAGGDLPLDKPKSTLAPVVAVYGESDEISGLTETAPDMEGDGMAERFILAFQPESPGDQPLKRALAAAAPRVFLVPPTAGPLGRVEPFASDMLMFSATGAASWPILDNLPPIDIAPAALSAR